MNFPKVFIIILNWNGLKDTLECLESVYKQDYPNFEVIVVDNGSTDDSARVIRQRYPDVILFENARNLGFTGGNNIGMRYAMEQGAEYLWLLNNDTLVESNTLKGLVNTAESSDGIGMVSPVIHYFENRGRIQFCGSYIDWEMRRISLITDMGEWQKVKNRSVSLWGTALLIKKAVVEKIGYLNNKLFAYGEDLEYSIRVNRAGFRNEVDLNSKIYHKDARSTGGVNSPMRVFLIARNTYLLWLGCLEGGQGAKYLRHYLGNTIPNLHRLMNLNLDKSVEACLSGIWAALKGEGGPFIEERRMPSLCKWVLLFLSSWHPYFWEDVFKGNFKFIGRELLRRGKRGIYKVK